MKGKKIIVVGAGPAGMMAAIRAKELHQLEVVLIEKNPSAGKKLLLSGKGRCNLTNTADLDAYFVRFSRQGEFLRDAFSKFFHPELIHFFEKRGLKLKIERQERVFPVTDNSRDILRMLKNELEKNKVRLIFNRAVKGVLTENKRVKGVALANGETMFCDKLILATGGISYRFTGSTGEGLAWAKALGHQIVPLRPGLVPLLVAQGYPRQLEGLTLKNIRLKIFSQKHKIISEIGELLFTRSGISGPLVLSLSGMILDRLQESGGVRVEIDLKPALSREQLEQRLKREFLTNPRRSLRNTLKELLAQRMIDLFIEILGIASDKKVNQLTRKECAGIISLLKGFGLDISGSLPIEEAMITRGGVSLKEINPRTMESRLINGLYFCGEMIDLDADTGGFNLQTAFSTGYLAGESAARDGSYYPRPLAHNKLQ